MSSERMFESSHGGVGIAHIIRAFRTAASFSGQGSDGRQGEWRRSSRQRGTPDAPISDRHNP